MSWTKLTRLLNHIRLTARVKDLQGKNRMQYELSQLAPGSYDILLRGVIIASLVRSGQAQNETWTAELLEEQLPGQRPAPFTQAEHSFSSFEDARKWLEGAEVRSSSEVQAWRR